MAYDRSPSKNIYLNVAVNTLKKLRGLVPSSAPGLTSRSGRGRQAAGRLCLQGSGLRLQRGAQGRGVGRWPALCRPEHRTPPLERPWEGPVAGAALGSGFLRRRPGPRARATASPCR